jgi:hemoglobin/transferrin/lactoferrin receptor protein
MLAALGLMVLSQGWAWAQEDQADDRLNLEPIIVSAQRTEMELLDTPFSLGSLDEVEIRRDPQNNVADQISRIPGVDIHAASGTASRRQVYIRGFEPGRVLILIDGVPQRKVGGIVPAASGVTIDPSEIARIEVIKGPVSALYGSDAIGGLVNIITKRGGDKPISFSLGATFDSSTRSLEPNVAIFGAKNGFNYRFFGTGVNAGERRLPNGDRLFYSRYKTRQYSAQVGYDWDHGRLTFRASEFDSESQFNPYAYDREGRIIPAKNMAEVKARSLYANVTDNLHADRETFSGKLELLELSEFIDKITISAYRENKLDDSLSTYVNRPGVYWQVTDKTSSLGSSAQIDFRLGANHLLNLGIDYAADKLKAKESYTGTPDAIREAKQETFGFFAQDQWRFHPDFLLTLGIRETVVKTKLSVDNTDPSNIGSTRANKLVFNLGLVYRGLTNFALRALYSQGYRTPTTTELYGTSTTRIGDPTLQPEESENYEIGLRYDNSQLTVDLSLYYAKLKNYISSREVDPANRVFQYFNSNGAKTWGAELAVDWNLGQTGFNPYLALTLARFQTIGDTGFKTFQSGRPEAYGTVGLKYRRPLYSGQIFTDAALAFASGNRMENDWNGSTSPRDASHRVDLTIGYEAKREHNFSFIVSLRNLTNQPYPNNSYLEPGFHAVVSARYEW